MKTLKDIVKALDEMPVEAFASWDKVSAVKLALERGVQRFQNSAERLQQLKRDTNKRLARRNRELELKRERKANVRQWIKDGTIIKGTFIKVRGARDGKGIREVISWDKDRLHCRQWLPEYRADLKHPDDLRQLGYIKVAGVWIGPMAQMTTHEYDKVSKILAG